MQPLVFGIVTPTYFRAKFLRSFIKNVKRQTYAHFHFVLVHDGPNQDMEKLALKLFDGDPRMTYLSTDTRGNNWGVSPRIAGIKYLNSIERKPDYLLMWDDDNEFYPNALATIADELNGHHRPDLLLVNMYRVYQLMPTNRHLALEHFEYVDTGTIVTKFAFAAQHYPEIEKIQGDLYEQDRKFYLRCLAYMDRQRIHVANNKIIGRYDGLRFIYTLRVRLRIPTLEYLNRFTGYRVLRDYLKKKNII